MYRPRERLKAWDNTHPKPQIAAIMIRQRQAMGFQFELVLADSLDGESKSNCVNVLDELKKPYILAIAPQPCPAVATRRQKGGSTTVAL